MDMCRFSGLDDIEYGKVIRALNRVLEATTKSAPSGVRSVLRADQRRTYLDSLRFNQIGARHATIKTAHAETCEWLRNKPEYQDWLDLNKISEHHGFLWIKGKPGTGKSTIMKFAYAHAQKTMTDTIVMSFFFNARGEHLEKAVLGMYRSLLFQLLEKLPELQSLFDFLGPAALRNSDFHEWTIENVKDIFGRAITNLGNRCLTCFIDALDECEEDEVREMVAFFEHLGQLAVSSRIRLRVCFSSRHYPYITIEKGIQLTLEGQDGHQQDIVSYLHSELKARRGNLVEQIRAEVLERANGTFLWVVLVVKMLNDEYRRGRMHALRKRLDEIPNELDELFKDILTRDSHNIEELILCLQWILYAKRPLKSEELYFAILAGVNPEAVTAWNPEEITKQDMERFILSSSKGLAEVTKSEDQTIQFIHESVRDFLKDNGLNGLRSDLRSNFSGLSHERLKQCCQTQLRIDICEYLPFSIPLSTASSEAGANLRQLAAEKFPFLEYAVRNVLHHADAADGYEISQDIFLRDFFLGGWVNLENLFERCQIRRYTSDVSLLYILAEQNLANLIRIELKRIPHMDINGERHGFPLFAALAHGNENAVRAFLMPDTGGWSDNEILDNHSSSSTVRDHQEATEYVFINRSSINPWKNRTLLSWAAERGDFGLVKILLATRKVDVNARTENGQTPLSQAARGGHDVIVQLLLTRPDIDVNLRDQFGYTPLSRAIARGYDVVVQLLLTRPDIDVNSRNQFGFTPLLQAASEGYDMIVQLLLTRPDIEVNSRDEHGWTALSCAIVGRHEKVMEQLLQAKANVKLRRQGNGEALEMAAAHGQDEVVKQSLQAKPDADTQGEFDSRALKYAAKQGYVKVVLELLRTNPDVDTRGKTYGVALWIAVENGHVNMVKQLLGVALSVDTQSLSWRDVLHLPMSPDGGVQFFERLLYRITQEEEKLLKFQQVMGSEFERLSGTLCRIRVRGNWYYTKE